LTSLEQDAADYELWLRVHNYATTTITCRHPYLAYFFAFAAEHDVECRDDLTLELLVAYQHDLYRRRKRNGLPLSVGTQAQRLLPLCQFCSWLRREGRLPDNPAADLLMPRPDRRLPEATLSAQEMAAVLAAPDVTRPLGLRDRAVLEVFYSCGLRRGELIHLLVRDIDVDRGTVFVRSGKGAKDGFVPIGERALFWVRLYVGTARPALLKGGASEYLPVSSAGNQLCPDWFCRQVRRHLATAGIHKRGSCHLLRHTVATLMLEGGADIRYVAEMLGHASLETTQRYTHVSIDRLRAVHSATHPAAGLSVATAAELAEMFPGLPGRSGGEE
jgi:integrase/recombinase XerD